MKKIAYIAAAILLIGCGGNEEGTDGTEGEEEATIINPPLDGDFQNDTLFRIDPTIESTVSTPNGSSIDIPANVLVDDEGNLITSEVELSFTQYHSMTDIMASGIPMTLESAEESGSFISAGMFTLNARADKKEVFIKDGEELTVNLASDKGDDRYNYYDMDEQTGDWTYDNSPKMPVSRNPMFDASRIPVEPQKADKNEFAIDLDFDVSDYSELTAFNGIVWEYAGNHDSLDPRKNPIVGKTRWNDFTLEPTYQSGYEYYLTMTKNQLSFTTIVRAALQGEDFELAMAEFTNRKKEIVTEMDRIQKPFIRSVNISGFGTENFDCVHDMEDPQSILADFNFGSNNSDRESAMVFVIYPDVDLCVNYPSSVWDKFAIDKASPFKILAILPGNKIAVNQNDPMEFIDAEKFEFSMNVLSKEVKEKGDLEKIIADL